MSLEAQKVGGLTSGVSIGVKLFIYFMPVRVRTGPSCVLALILAGLQLIWRLGISVATSPFVTNRP